MYKFIVLLTIVAFAAAFEPLSQQHVDYINSIQSSWKAGINFPGKTMEDVRVYLGTYLDTPDYLKLPMKPIVPIEASLPTSFDARTQWSNCVSVSEIRDQGNCGSCWAFAAVEAMSDRICIQSSGSIQTRISAENLITCCDGWTCGNGCQGGYPSGAWSYWTQTGIVSGYMYGSNYGCQDYFIPSCGLHCNSTIANTPACSNQCRSGYNTPYTSDLNLGSTSYSVSSDVTQIMQEIMTNGPVEAAFTVYSDFMSYKSGVYKHVSGSEEGGHAVKILGWGNENGEDYWIIANSWSSAWGMNGFFYMLKGADECGIESQIVAGMAQ